MNKPLLIGLAAIIAAIVLFILGGVEFNTQQEVFRLGNLSATATTSRTIPALRYIALALFLAGIVLFAFGFKKRR